MKKVYMRYCEYWNDKTQVFSTISGLVLLVVSLFVSRMATTYATEVASNSVNDIFLSNVPTVNVDLVVNEGALLFILFIALLILARPSTMPFVMKSTALFVFIRSISITLTHLGLSPERSFIDSTELFGRLNLGSDLFFSGHTGLPFLMTLIFWEKKWIRHVCLTASVIFGISVLLGHLHYSIDVFAAYFITYAIYHIAMKLFSKDFALFY